MSLNDDDVLKNILKNTTTDEDETSDVVFDVIIPENPSLEDIAKIALTAYKDQMADIQNMTPKYRARSLEVAQMFLNVAKDALSKKDDNKIKEDKLELDKSKANANKKPTGDEEKPVTRRELLLELQKKTVNAK